MIKTEYLGCELDLIERESENYWIARYWTPYNFIEGTGHTLESAVADAQRQIQESQGLRKRG